MFHIGIIYAPYDSKTAEMVREMETVASEKGFDLRTKRASEASIVDINASDIVILISDGKGDHKINPDYSEIARALKGVNLSGRIAGVISLGGTVTLKAFKEILEDTGIEIRQLNFNDGQANPGKWLLSIINEYKETMNERGINE